MTDKMKVIAKKPFAWAGKDIRVGDAVMMDTADAKWMLHRNAVKLADPAPNADVAAKPAAVDPAPNADVAAKPAAKNGKKKTK